MPEIPFENAPSQKYPLAPTANSYPLSSSSLVPAGASDELQEDVSELASIISIFRRRWGLILGVGILVGTYVGYQQFSKPPIYQESFQMLVQPPGADIPNPLQAAQQMINNNQQNALFYQTQVQMMLSNRLLSPVVERIRTDFFQGGEVGQNFTVAYLQGGLRIAQVKDTELIEVGFSGSDPRLVKFVLSRLAEVYLSNALAEQAVQTSQKLSFVDKQIPLAKQKIQSLEGRLKDFRLKTGFINPQAQGEILSQSLIEANKNKQTIDAQVKEANVLYKDLRQQLGVSEKEARAVVALTESGRYMGLINKLREIDTKLAAESTRFTDDSIIIQQLREERKNLIPLINEEAKIALQDMPTPDRPINNIFVVPNSIRTSTIAQLLATANQRNQALARQQSARASEQKLKNDVQNFARAAGEYATLTREMEIANQSLASLLQARQALEVETAKKFTPWRLVTEIVAPTEPEQNALRNILMASLAGLVAGTAAAFLAENLDRAFHSPDDLAKKTGLPILGIIPFLTTLGKFRPDGNTSKQEQPQSPLSVAFLEAFSLLYTNLFFLRERKPFRSIVVSSAIPGEGKSTTAFFLAKGAAALGQRVLLIDGDRYFPQKDRWSGLSQLMEHRPEPWETSQNAGEMEPIALGNNLFVIRNDRQSLKPNQLIASRSLTQLIERWESEFDLVVVDAPPLLGIADTKLLARQADGLLLVVRMDETSRELVQQVVTEMRIAEIPIIGAVANGASATNSKYNYYYKYYRRAKYGHEGAKAEKVTAL